LGCENSQSHKKVIGETEIGPIEGGLIGVMTGLIACPLSLHLNIHRAMERLKLRISQTLLTATVESMSTYLGYLVYNVKGTTMP